MDSAGAGDALDRDSALLGDGRGGLAQQELSSAASEGLQTGNWKVFVVRFWVIS